MPTKVSSPDLCFDPAEAVARLRRSDRTLGQIIRRAGPFTHRPQGMHSPFEALLRAIIYQQLSGKAAATIAGRVSDLCQADGRIKPAQILALSEVQLRGAGLSRAKVLAVRDLAERTLEGTVPTLARLKKMDDEEIIERLIEVRGVGRWTAEMLLIFKLGRPDVLPVADFGVRKGFMLAYGLKTLPTPTQLAEHAECWRPFRSVGSWYMWRAVELLGEASL